MSPRIRVLDDALVDQIAAGEVVERPASVVKELLENALDAGARRIAVEILEGGVELCRVSDDGCGMTSDDALLAIKRHATSKIRALEDLAAIDTLGFRGEALPSIASVARFVLTTRPGDSIAATEVRIEGGELREVREVGAAPGTTVEVRELFYNVPARRKFLKARQTEAGHVSDTCLRVALAHPQLRLTLNSNGRRVHEFLPVADHAERARAAFAAERLSDFEVTRDGIHLRALLGAPETARSGARRLYLFVNGRPIADRQLARAVAFAYGSVLPPGKYPTGVLHLELDPRDVDVNAHPQKAEVRFARGRSVLDTVTRALASRLGTQAWSGPASRGTTYWDQRLGGSLAREAAEAAPKPPRASSGDPWGLSVHLRPPSPSPIHGPHAAPPPSAPHAEPPAAGTPPSDPAPEISPAGGLLPARGFFGSLRFLGQVRRMLLVCEGPDALHVIDQHAADERLRYHQLRRAHEAARVTTQRLLFPERVEVSGEEAGVLEEAHEALRRMGMEVTLLGPTTAAVHAVPALVSRAPAARLLRDVLDELGRTGERAFGDAVDTALATMACHGAIRAGDALSAEECTALLRALDEVDAFRGHCPHGRPVVYSVPLSDIERRLGR